MINFKNIKRPFIVAEMSGNHNRSLETALKMIEVASECGVDAVKFQTYTPDTITLDVRSDDFLVKSEANLWEGEYLYDLYKQAFTPWEWHEPMFKRCHELGLSAFSSPFDLSAVDFLEELNVPCYKIASFEIVDLPLIRYVAQKGKPIIMSTGMASFAEVEEAVQAAKGAGCTDIVLLKCTSNYPANHTQANLRTLPILKEAFNCQVGISDHTMGLGTSIMSLAFGSIFIEKHFTLSRADGGVDAAFSMEPHEMKQLVLEANRAFDSIGHVQLGPTENELGMKRFRRSLYAVKDIEAGEPLTKENIRSVRPSKGLKPKYFDSVMDSKAKQNISKGTALEWELLE
tara:strand:- start:40603 stop:41634 length:1032 start_codon:yes stop_codon:yes gene_type:complete